MTSTQCTTRPTTRRFGRNVLSPCPDCGRSNVLAPVDEPDHSICASCWDYAECVENVHLDNCQDGMVNGVACLYCSGVTPAMWAERKAPSGRTQAPSTADKAGTHTCPECERSLPVTKFPTSTPGVRDYRRCRPCRDSRRHGR